MKLVKIGGSLLYRAKPLLKALKECGEKIIIVPGGGEFANVVRKVDKTYNLDPSVSHKLAIECMDLVGEIYGDVGNIKTYKTLFDIKREIDKVGVAILLPSTLLLSTDLAEHSWNVTSDSLSLYVGRLLNLKEIIIVTDVDGIYREGKLLNIINANEIEGLTSVDMAFPSLLQKFNMTAYVVNGLYPERVVKLIKGENTICTKIVSR
ncbi:[5-(aminomethyl)furan-3-yl]methyl phosphate kinase [Methanocaldococcus infernus]